MLALLANPWVLGGIAAALIASHVGVGYKAYQMGEDHCVAENAKLVAVEIRTRDAALAAAGEAIAAIEVRNVTIRQKAETITREVPVYRDCRHDDRGLQLINSALTDGAEPAGQDELPEPDSARR